MSKDDGSNKTISKPEQLVMDWALVAAWVAFIIATLFFLALDPSSIIMAAIMPGPLSWLVRYWWMPSVYVILTFVAPVVFILAGISIFFTYKKSPTKMRTVLILLSNIAIGLPITWLSLNGIIPMKIIVYAIIMGAISVAPIILLIVFRIRDKKKIASQALPKPTNEKTAKIVFIVSLTIVVIELGFTIFQLITPASNHIDVHEKEKQVKQTINSAAESSDFKSSKNLPKMVYAVCNGEYYFKADEAVALMKIGKNPNLYSSQTRDAIKFHRHISAVINNGKTITLEQLRTTLQNSFEEGL